ncbi:hypothetical protein [Bacillus cereus group sp. BfR-BA-00415]|uniref:hypothetical protein n=1 Tax=Bacillus cereus group sp. BfR-BA-00415 TaxID=3094867 RepID=UPI0029C13FFC|nr:hypothetical protein [Bacillus cereus group sp. BfR-BA-00415]MDX5942262.1 hypothetical protein [Bacillus cereus group sp. BfR-BA-00415]
MKRIDFHEIDFEKMKIVDKYEYHSEDYHSYHLEFKLPKFPKESFLISISVWGNEWSFNHIYQMHRETKYILDSELKEKFVAALKKILAIS